MDVLAVLCFIVAAVLYAIPVIVPTADARISYAAHAVVAVGLAAFVQEVTKVFE